MKSITIALTGVAIPLERLRALQPEAVATLAASMKQHGQLHPITVRKRPGRGYWVVAGAHRLTAAEELRWKEIECVVLDDCTADEAELIEIDENLARAELTAAETAMHVAKRQELYERMHGKAKANGAKAANKAMGRGDANEKFADAFTKDTASKTGQSERKVQLDAARGAALGDDLKRIAGTSLDKGVELDALVKLSKEERAPIIERAVAGEHVSARKQHPATEIDTNCEAAIETLVEHGLVDAKTERLNTHGKTIVAALRAAALI